MSKREQWTMAVRTLITTTEQFIRAEREYKTAEGNATALGAYAGKSHDVPGLPCVVCLNGQNYIIDHTGGTMRVTARRCEGMTL